MALSGRSLPDACRVGDDRHEESILEAIGNTPLVRVGSCAPTNGAELWLKLEYSNPTGSMMDRMALVMIEGAERDGLICPGDTLRHAEKHPSELPQGPYA